jgi:hypothetical protein
MRTATNTAVSPFITEPGEGGVDTGDGEVAVVVEVAVVALEYISYMPPYVVRTRQWLRYDLELGSYQCTAESHDRNKQQEQIR